MNTTNSSTVTLDNSVNDTSRDFDPNVSLASTILIEADNQTDYLADFYSPIPAPYRFRCSMCRLLSDTRRTSYICVTCLTRSKAIRLCHCCLVLESLRQGRVKAHPEWQVAGHFDIIIEHKHFLSGEELTPAFHRLVCIPGNNASATANMAAVFPDITTTDCAILHSASTQDTDME